MGLIRNAANRKIVGRIGDTTYYVSNQRQIARQALNSSNFGETARRTEAQQRRRVKWSNLVNFYKLSKSWMHSAYESKTTKQSDYNRFMSVNINTSKVALTRTEAVQGACVVEPFIVSQGSLKPIEQTKSAGMITTDIKCTLGSITAATRVKDFAQDLVDNNQNIEFMMQLSFISYQQGISAAGVPYVTLGQYEVTLDPENTKPVTDYLPGFTLDIQGGGYLSAVSLSKGAHTYVLSQRTSTGLKVSTQQLIDFNEELIAQYSTTEQLFKAINSYGLDQEVMLNPNTLAEEPYVPVVLGIDHVSKPGTSFNRYAGDVVTFDDLQSQFRIEIHLLNNLAPSQSITAVAARVFNSSDVHMATSITIAGNVITAGFEQGSWFDNNLEVIGVVLSDETEARIEFANS